MKATVLVFPQINNSHLENSIPDKNKLNTRLNKYRNNYNIYKTEKNIIYGDKTSTQYFRFIINPHTNLISEGDFIYTCIKTI